MAGLGLAISALGGGGVGGRGSIRALIIRIGLCGVISIITKGRLEVFGVSARDEPFLRHDRVSDRSHFAKKA